MIVKAKDVLNSHNLKRTSCREGIVEAVLSADRALSEIEIRERLTGNYDRTTFYRSFKTLEEHKIIHKIVVDQELVKYALDQSITKKGAHAHFYCNDCHMVKCFDSNLVQIVQLPDGYVENEREVIIKGTCPHCNKTV